jgi:hypothetical protein
MRKLSRVLDAVQRLVDQKDEDPEGDALNADEAHDDPTRTLHLLDVKSGSATYAVAGTREQTALAVLNELGQCIASPQTSDWPDSALSSVRQLSEVAKSLGCDIEFRQPGKKRQRGDVIAKITPKTYGEISQSAFISAHTSVYAKIERVGGAVDMHCGIRLADSPRKMIICRVANENLVRELGQYIYQYVVLVGQAKWLRHNWKLKQLIIESFEPKKTGSILETLRRVHDFGGHAWDQVDDPDALIAEMRSS